MIRRLTLIALGAVLGAYVGRWLFQKGYNAGAKDTQDNYGKVLRAETDTAPGPYSWQKAVKRQEEASGKSFAPRVATDQYITFDHGDDENPQNPPIVRDQYGLNDPEHKGARFSFNEVVAQTDAMIRERRATQAAFDRMWPGRGDR
jgi:hypothetical protein